MNSSRMLMFTISFLLLQKSHCIAGKYRLRNSKTKQHRPTLQLQAEAIQNSVYRDKDFLAKADDQIEAVGVGAFADNTIRNFAEVFGSSEKDIVKNTPISMVLEKIQKDMKILDEAAGNTAQLSNLEIGLLGFTVMSSGVAPILFSSKVVELLVPAMAALSAAVGISAEYNGKVAVSTGKEIAAAAIQAAAEAEGILAGAERVKSVLPLSVGIATSASAFSLLAPTLALELQSNFGIEFPFALYFFMPLVAVLAAAVSALATAESNSLARRATGVGNRRFASKGDVGNTWLSTTEQLQAQSERSTIRWYEFGLSVVPAPIVGAIFPGAISFKAVVVATFAAAQAAYYLCVAEFALAEAVDAVAVKARAAAVADTYANQGARAGSILPFTSALAGLCAAGSAAATEVLPFISFLPVQSLVATLFPSGAALFAAAASISKARCEIDSIAAAEAASSGLVGRESNDNNDNTPSSPIQVLRELIKKTVNSTWLKISRKLKKLRKNINRRFGSGNDVPTQTTGSLVTPAALAA